MAVKSPWARFTLSRGLALTVLGCLTLLMGACSVVGLCRQGPFDSPSDVVACEQEKKREQYASFQRDCRQTEAEDLRRDRATLERLYHATGGPDWTSSENWLSEAPLSEWRGVQTGSCGGEVIPMGGVVSLYLAENNLKGPLPAELGNLTDLGELNLSRNAVTGSIPLELANLGFLEELDLSYNDLTGEIPPIFGDFNGLAWVDLSHNQLSGQIPVGFGDMNHGFRSTTIVLNDNRLTGPLPSDFSKLHDLYFMRLGGTNRFTGCVPNNLRPHAYSYVDLDSLGIPRCQAFEKAILMSFYHATGGPEWTRSNNWPPNYPWPRPRGRFPNVGPPLDDWYGVDTDHFTGRVTDLRLADNGLEGELPTELSRLPELSWLDLSGNDLAGDVTPFLEEFDSVSIELGGNDRLTGCLPGIWEHLLTGLDLPPC